MPEDKPARRKGRRSQRRGKREPLYAAIDLGTNNCRLLVARRDGDAFRVIDSYSKVVRLGEGLSATGRLSEAAMERAMEAFADIKTKLKHHRVAHLRCIATEACRRAENGEAFIRRARTEAGLSFKIIGGSEEAKLAAIGCHNLFEAETDLVMVLDIGGGSTEIAFVELSQLETISVEHLVKKVPIQSWRSFPIGVVTLTESHDELSEPEQYRAMLAHARDSLGAWKKGVAYSERMSAENAYIIGTSGTVTCLAGIHLELDRYRRNRVDGLWMKTEDMKQVIDEVARIGRDGRLALPTVGEDRADLMMAGCAILEAAVEIWPSSRMRVADRGLREGLLLSMIHGAKSNRRRRRRKRRSPGDTAQADNKGSITNSATESGTASP